MAGDEKTVDKGLWRDLVAYWFLGLCNNYGYVVMLCAAHDIIGNFHSEKAKLAKGHDTEQRYCHYLSTGAILLADILPSLSVKMVLPFVPFWVNTRIAVAIILSALGFLFVGAATDEGLAILGVVVTSASCGIGEATFLSYSAHFNKNVISTWSSGTGGAGIVGALSYATLISLGLSPSTTMYVMVSFPIFEALIFWVLLRAPQPLKETPGDLGEEGKPLKTFKEKILYIKQLLKFMIPLGLVYFFEYFINQGLFELVSYDNIFLDKPAQYRWYNVDYQIGVFVSRSSVNIITFRKIWIMAVLQGINVLYFLSDVFWFYTPSIWITFLVVFWEGLLGGAGYVNTFYRMAQEIPPERQHFAMSVVVQADSIGITTAGFTAIPVHNAICRMPAKARRM